MVRLGGAGELMAEGVVRLPAAGLELAVETLQVDELVLDASPLGGAR